MELLLVSILTASIGISRGFYTEETPVKILQVESVADRYPASDSQYRISVENGFVSSIVLHNSINHSFPLG